MKTKSVKTKIVALALTALTSFSLMGCSASKTQTLDVGISVDYPPFEYYAEDGTTLMGVDIDIATEIAHRMGTEPKFIDREWIDIFDGLDKQEYNIIISACTITPERLEKYDFSDSYVQNFPCIVTLKDAEVKPCSPSELEGLSVCYQKGTSSDSYITSFIAENNLNCDTYAYSKIISCFEELAINRVNAIFVDSTVAVSYCSDPESIYEITWQQATDPEEFGIVVPKDSPELLEQINQMLKDMKADGTLDTILDKYF